MPDEINIAYALRLAPQKAMEYFNAKGYALSPSHWSEILAQAHAKAFTVARVARMDLLQDMHGALKKSLADGQTLKQFRDNIEPTLKAKGWWGKKTIKDPYTGKERVVQLGSPRRLRTIYQENMVDAYAAGDWQAAVENMDDRPYGQWHCRKVRSRPSHIALDKKVFPLSDPFWKTHIPGKLDWGCHCSMTTLTAEEVREQKLTVESSAGRMSQREVTVQATGQVVNVPVYTDPATGVSVAAGVGRGYNPAMAAYQPDLDAYHFDIARNYIQGAVTGPAFQRFYEGKSQEDFPVAVLAEQFRNVIGAKSQTVRLSAETLQKNKKHSELDISHYQGVQQIMEGAQLIIKDGDFTIAFIRREDVIYQASVKATRSGETLFLTSLRRSTVEDAQRMIRSGRVIRNEGL